MGFVVSEESTHHLSTDSLLELVLILIKSGIPPTASRQEIDQLSLSVLDGLHFDCFIIYDTT